MAEKSEQFIGGGEFSLYSRQWIEEKYPFAELTDRRWEVIVDYCANSKDEEEFESALAHALYNIAKVEAEYEALGKTGKPTKAHSPKGWDTVFDKLADRPDLRSKVANFGVKYRLAQDLRTSAFEGDSATTDSYYVMLKLSIYYSAIEALELIIGKGEVSVCDRPTVREFKKTEAWQPFLKMLDEVVDSPRLKGELDRMGIEGGHDDLRPVFESVRNGFFHPRLTAQNSTLTANPKLRSFLLQVCEMCRIELELVFSKWADGLTHAGGYAKKDIESQYEITFTDNQWQILLDEIDGEDEHSVEEVIEDVVTNMATFEKEYQWWQEQVAAAAAEKALERNEAESHSSEDKNS